MSPGACRARRVGRLGAGAREHGQHASWPAHRERVSKQAQGNSVGSATLVRWWPGRTSDRWLVAQRLCARPPGLGAGQGLTKQAGQLAAWINAEHPTTVHDEARQVAAWRAAEH